MTSIVYDESFGGLLTAIFEIYERKLDLVSIIRESVFTQDAFSSQLVVATDDHKAERVWKGLQQKLSTEASHNFYACYLSELPHIENDLLAFARHVFNSKQNVETDLGVAVVLKIKQTARKVFREKHRMEAFVRFQLTEDNIYYATIEPDYNVLPLISRHFETRYADQHWVIYDKRRKFGLYYSPLNGKVEKVSLTERNTGQAQPQEMFDKTEQLYQLLWKDYFHNVNIPERKNLKLHIQHIPVRYWKYLPEKHS